jgi:hypothetical protein
VEERHRVKIYGIVVASDQAMVMGGRLRANRKAPNPEDLLVAKHLAAANLMRSL